MNGKTEKTERRGRRKRNENNRFPLVFVCAHEKGLRVLTPLLKQTPTADGMPPTSSVPPGPIALIRICSVGAAAAA